MSDAELSDLVPDRPRPGKAFSASVRMCAKCCRKLETGKNLRKAVKAAIRSAYGDDVRLEKVDCFSLCPKGGQVLSTGAGITPRRLVIIQPESDVQSAVDYLLAGPGRAFDP